MNPFGSNAIDLSERPTAAALGKLAPYRHLKSAQLDELAGTAQFSSCKRGRLAADWAGSQVLFLNSGQLEISDAEGRRTSLSSVSPAARYPLPSAGGYRMRVLHPVTFLRLPVTDHLTTDWPIERPERPQPHLHGDELDTLRALRSHLSAGGCRLPSMPHLAIELSRTMSRPDFHVRDIVKLIQLDPALAAKLMRVANSAAFQFRKKARNVQQAVTRLGQTRVRNLAIGFLVREAFQARTADLRRRSESLWIDSCHVAAVSFMLAKHIPGLDPERAMLAGLIHRIGALPVLGFANQSDALRNNTGLLDYATELFAKALGVRILQQWELGDDLTDVVRLSDAWGRIGQALPDYVDVVLLAQLHTRLGKPHAEHLPRIDNLPAYQKLDLGSLTPRRSIAILEQADHDIQELRQILSVAT